MTITVVRGGHVVTMDGQRRVVDADVVVARGRISDIQPHARLDGPARVIDARRCAVIPGLIQSHVHLCQTLFRGLADELPLLRWLRERIWPLEAAHDARSIAASVRLGLAEMILTGTTAVLDMGTVHLQDVVFETMQASGIRGLSGKAMMDAGRDVPEGLKESSRASLRESEALYHRWNGRGRLGYAFAPRFVLSCSTRLLRETAHLAADLGAIVHTHASEHAGEAIAVRKRFGKPDVRVLQEVGLSGPRVVLAHGVQLTQSMLRSIARAQTRLVHCPSANLKLSSGIAPVASMREAGIVVGLGCDGAACNNRMDPWAEMRLAALLGKVRAQRADAVAATAALEMATIDGARVLGLESEIGSIEVGKRADLAVVQLDTLHTQPIHDVASTLVYASRASDVRHVMVSGELLVRNGELLNVDVPALLRTATRERDRLLRRAALKT